MRRCIAVALLVAACGRGDAGARRRALEAEVAAMEEQVAAAEAALAVATAQRALDRLASEAYPRWAARPESAGRCPTIAELVGYLDSVEGAADPAAGDPWGHPYAVACRAGGLSITVSSLGPDGQPGTADDLAAEK